MALPTITSNSPGAGSISWTAFNITYAGISYAVAAASSSRKFVWWEYRAGAPALVDGDTLPNLGADDLLLFLNKNGVGLLVPMTEIVEGSLIVSGSILADAIAANQINTGHLQADSVTTAKIATGAVTADEVAAGAVTTSKLSVGSVSEDLVQNGSFEDVAGGVAEGWQNVTQTNGSIAVVTGVASSGVNALRLAATTTAANVHARQAPAQYIPVSNVAGRSWHISARMGAGTATTKGATLRADWYDAAKVFISSTNVVADAALGTTFDVYEGQVTPPGSTTKYMAVSVIFAAPNVVSNMYVDQVAAREVIVAARIGDGQISTPKLAAGSVVTDKLAAGAVVADKIAANAVVADKIAAGAIVAGKLSATAIDGMVITGATVRTAAAGARWNMDAAGLKGYDAAGTEYFSGTSTGISITGSLKATGGSGYVSGTPLSTTLGNYGASNTPGVYFSNANDPLGVNDDPAGMYSNFGTGVLLTSRSYGDGYDARVSIGPSADKSAGEILIAADNSLPTGNGRIMLSYQNGAKLLVNNKAIETLPLSSFANGFSNHSSGQPVTTSRVSATRVVLTGMTNHNSVTNDVIIGYINTAHAPTTKVFLPTVVNTGGTNTFYPCVITVETNGTVRYRPPAGQGIGGYLMFQGTWETA